MKAFVLEFRSVDSFFRVTSFVCVCARVWTRVCARVYVRVFVRVLVHDSMSRLLALYLATAKG